MDVFTQPTWLLRAEALAEFVAAVLAFTLVAVPQGASWWLLTLFLWPDVAFLAYRAGPRLGAIAYNLLHSSPLAFLLLAVGLLLNNATLLGLGLLWLAHIGFDRSLGFGLKLATGFDQTHLGTLKSSLKVIS
jgi:hypothetical protein